jgi:hypothetical protein
MFCLLMRAGLHWHVHVYALAPECGINVLICWKRGMSDNAAMVSQGRRSCQPVTRL